MYLYLLHLQPPILGHALELRFGLAAQPILNDRSWVMIDIIGDLYEPVEFPEGFVPGDPEPAPVQIAGWHVNVSPEVLADRPELEPYVVTPEPFRRVWTGDDPNAPTMTVALLFEGEAEGREFFPD